MFEIGQILTKENYTQGAIWCNANNAHIEAKDGQYVIVANVPAPELTLEEQVAKLEAEIGLTRVMREMVLAENSGVSDYVKAKANEIEEYMQVKKCQLTMPDSGKRENCYIIVG